jgi:F-type H+-transporting ATPase subunit epsilon
MAVAHALHCSVITPEARVFDGPAESVTIPAHDGEIGILPNRAPLVARLGAGRMHLRAADGTVENWFIDSGFAQVLENRVVVLTQKAVRPEEIDTSRAAEQLAAARAMPAKDDVAFRRKAAAEASARAQLRVAGRA